MCRTSVCRCSGGYGGRARGRRCCGWWHGCGGARNRARLALQVQQRTQTLDVGRHGALGVMFDGISEVIRAAMRQSWTTEKEKQVWQYLADRDDDGKPFVYKRKPSTWRQRR